MVALDAPERGITTRVERSMQNMVAVYPTREKAIQVREVLVDSGVPASQIELSPERSTTASASSEDRPRGFWDFLFGPGGIFGGDVPDEHRSWYEQNLTQGRTALCVHLQQTSCMTVWAKFCMATNRWSRRLGKPLSLARVRPLALVR
jgi:hypothetical protein